jgi:hypothetical protein
VHPELTEAFDFHEAIVAEAGKALVGLREGKGARQHRADVGDSDDVRQGRAAPGERGQPAAAGRAGASGKTFFGVIIAAISDAKFARIQGAPTCSRPRSSGFR